jgi:hypothetical protein
MMASYESTVDREADEIRKLVDRFSFGGGLSRLHARLSMTLATASKGLLLFTFSIEVADRENPDRLVPIRSTHTLPVQHFVLATEGMKRRLHAFIRKSFTQLLLHELDESLRFDGQLVLDVHSHARPR